MMHKTWSSIEEVSIIFFTVIRKISGSHGTKKTPILTRIEGFRIVT